MLANYHTHTPRCNHAVGEEQCYVERAVEGGLKLLGFSDHTPYLFDKPGYYSSFRMRPEELDDYVQTLQKLRTKYADRIELHIGLEAEYYPKLFPRLLDFLRQYPVEYLILGQHALYNEVEGIYPAQPTTDRKLLDQYLGQTLDALDSGVFTYFAHPDLFCFEISKIQKQKTPKNIGFSRVFRWSCYPDLNRGPHPYQGCALPAEL